MTGFSRRPIAALVCCLFAGLPAAHAANGDTPVLLAALTGAGADNSALRLEKRFNLLARKKRADKLAAAGSVPAPIVLRPADDYPLFLSADRMEGQTEELAEAEGNVELRKSGMVLTADRVRYRPLEDEVDAQGKVNLQQEGSEIEAEHLRMKLSEQIGFADQARYRVVKEVESKLYEQNKTFVTVASVNGANSGAPMMLNVANVYGLPTESPEPRQSEARGTAERIDFAGENRMRMENSTFSTCRAPSPDWYMKASRLDLDFDENVGRADSASLWFKGMPLFYSPVAWFPLNNQRRSGVLTPSIKQSTNTGFDLSLPYYWNIAPNYDATFYPRVMSKRGFQLGVETRYLSESNRGEIRAEYMSSDRDEADRRRYAYEIHHLYNFGSGLSAALNWNGVSDDRYWEDLSSRLLQTSQVQLVRQATVSYAPNPWLQSSLQVLRYQTLQPDPENPIARPYFLEPQLNLIGYRPNLLGMDFNLLGQYTKFTHEDKASKDRGERMVIYPQVSLPLVTPALQVVPKIGLHASSYSIDRSLLNGGGSESFSRVLPTFSVDSTLVLEREGELLGNAYLQTLEPRLYYVWIPYKDQSQIPVFDTGITDFNFAQVFSENRYSGYDRINDANQLTAALTTRILNADTGAERFRAMIGQRYYFTKQRVSLPGETSRQDEFSNLIASVSGLVAPKTYAEATWEYNYKDRINERFSAGVRFQPDYGKVLSASYRYTRDPLTNAAIVDQVDFAGQWPLAPQWYAVGRYNYSMRDHKMLETIGGLEYNAGCWAMRGVVQRLAATSGSPNTSFFLQLELQDFTSIGSNPLGLLRRSIPGYGKTNELPNDRSLISNQ